MGPGSNRLMLYPSADFFFEKAMPTVMHLRWNIFPFGKWNMELLKHFVILEHVFFPQISVVKWLLPPGKYMGSSLHF